MISDRIARKLGHRAGPRLKELIEQRGDLTEEAAKISDDADTDKHTPARQARFVALTSRHGQLSKINDQIETARQQETDQKIAAAFDLREKGEYVDTFRLDINHPDYGKDRITKVTTKSPMTTSKLNAFTGPRAAEDAYHCGMWLRAVVARNQGHTDPAAEAAAASAGFGIHATATEGNDSLGGFTVPDPLASAIIETRERVGVSRQLADIRTMTADTLRIPVQTDGPVVTYPGEANAITPGDSTWGQVNLTAVKRAILSKISNELQADAIINIVDQCASRMGYEFAKQEDHEFINGDGTAAFGGETGLLAALGTAGQNTITGVTDWASLTLKDFTSTMGILPSAHTTGGESWICSNGFYYDVMVKLLTESGGNTLVNLEAGTGSRPTFMGKPVFLTDEMPKASAAATVACLYGAFRDGVIIGDRTQIQIGMSSDRYFEEDVLALRALARYDILVHDGGDASNAGAYVGLKTT